VDLAVDKLVVEGRKVTTAAASTLCHFAVNKPVGYICSNVSKQPGKRAVDLLQPWLDQWQQKHKVCSLCDCHTSYMCVAHN
jgi:16S rRNA U516 pseudouridylate synthase RsuA-like enzyme